MSSHAERTEPERSSSGVLLLVDDNPVRLDSMTVFLKSEGYDVQTAVDSQSALALIPSIGPDLVISDVVMPGIDGFELCRRIKKNPSTASIPVMLVSGLRFDDTAIALGFEAGADDYLESDGPVELLVRKTTQLVSLRLEQRARRKAEEALRESEERFEKAFRSNPNLMAIYRLADSICVDANESFLRVTGFARDEVVGHALTGLDLVAANERGQWEEILCASEPIRNREIKFRIRNGELRTGLLSAEPIVVSGVKCVLVVASDVTERKQLEEQLHHSQKMEAVGTLAGGIAHDFNNLLTAIIGYSQIIRSLLSTEDPLQSQIAEIESAGIRAASLTSQLLAFSRKQVLEPKVLNLNSTIREMETMLRRLLGEDIELSTNTDPALASVRADPGQIEQVIMNLAINARDAMPRGGRLTIETRNLEIEPVYLADHAGITPGQYVMFAVSDTGQGMDQKTMSRIFEPFFTTKEPGKGTGLGLSTSYGIIKQSGGNIAAYSEPGYGSVFKVYLPRVDERPEALTPKADRIGAQYAGTETILLVEDEEIVRKLAAEVLRLGGYNAIEAAGGGDALLICERNDTPIDLVITDAIMPQISGKELAERLARLKPEMKILIMSGYTGRVAEGFGLPVYRGFLQKPFTPDSLLKKVRETLDKGV